MVLKKIDLIQEIIYHRYSVYSFFYDFTILLLGTNGQASTTLGICTAWVLQMLTIGMGHSIGGCLADTNVAGMGQLITIGMGHSIVRCLADSLCGRHGSINREAQG